MDCVVQVLYLWDVLLCAREERHHGCPLHLQMGAFQIRLENNAALPYKISGTVLII